jgi:hypothetical protein
MNPWDVMKQLYDAELNSGIEMNAGWQTDWDGGITVWLGGPNRIVTKRIFDRNEFDQVASWLDAEARRLFPDDYPPRRKPRQAVPSP